MIPPNASAEPAGACGQNLYYPPVVDFADSWFLVVSLSDEVTDSQDSVIIDIYPKPAAPPDIDHYAAVTTRFGEATA